MEASADETLLWITAIGVVAVVEAAAAAWVVVEPALLTLEEVETGAGEVVEGGKAEAAEVITLELGVTVLEGGRAVVGEAVTVVSAMTVVPIKASVF